MLVKSNTHIDLKPERVSKRNDAGPVAKKTYSTKPVSFQEMLQQQIAGRENAEPWATSVLPLEKEHLTAVIEMIRIQMNSFLFSEIPGGSDDSLLYRFSSDWITHHPMQGVRTSNVSKVRHNSKETATDRSAPDISEIIGQASDRFDVDPDLIRAVIRAESNFKPDATSPKGAMGLMQLMPETAAELGVRNPYNPSENVMAGTWYLKRLIDRYDGDVPTALAAYNWGMGNIERRPDRMPEETKTYISRVDSYYHENKAQQQS